MPRPIEFMNRYRNIVVNFEFDDAAARVCRTGSATVRLNKYFMMHWMPGTTEMTHFSAVSAGSAKDRWFQQNRQRIQTAAMGKGAPEDYGLALQWAVESQKIKNPSQATIQAYFDQNLGIDCSGFATNYLVACGKLTKSVSTLQNTGAESYFQPAKAVDDPSRVQPGDLLVLMKNNVVVRGPGHVMVVDSYFPGSKPGGNMRVVEATAAGGANPKLLDSMYSIEKINDKGGAVPCMILDVKRFNTPASVAVIRF
jgi:hypothetical protein